MQELSAIEMRFRDRQIIDIFHAHAFATEGDDWSRKHVHGLSIAFLKEHGYSSESELISSFKSWLREKNYLYVYSNAPHKEEKALLLNICDIGLPPWIMRDQQSYHKLAQIYKHVNLKFDGKCCSNEAHSAFEGVDKTQNGHPLTKLAKEKHGYHCSLYDCWEMYMCLILS